MHGGKGTTWEGGVREPAIAWWPGRIAAGTACDATVSEMDVLPTVVKLAGGEVPTNRKIDGKDVWPLLAGRSKESPHQAFFYFNSNQLQAVRSGPWKLAITPQGTGMFAGAAQPVKHTGPRLYNLDSDLGELSDVASQHADVVARLEKLVKEMDADLGETGVGPGVRTPIASQRRNRC